MNEYCIPVSYGVVRDVPDFTVNEERLRFHLESNDYFGVQAAVLGGIEEKMMSTDSLENSRELALVRMLRAEAELLHRSRYRIESAE